MQPFDAIFFTIAWSEEIKVQCRFHHWNLMWKKTVEINDKVSVNFLKILIFI